MTAYKDYARKINAARTIDLLEADVNDKTSQYKKVVIRIDKKTYYPAIIHMESAQANFVADIQCDSYQKNQMFSDKTFQFDQKKYPDVDVIDLR